ncbi:M48 family peptidase [Leptospira kemamanensis]|uniref:M48 family peptidase n=1 Tax=Leptospira kemamanensis TaxID=2484942 RepID=A0A4R9JTQ6_9LEPT|nr:SprT family zinc-dependent metalloprotease [Leptospira kemamanensis]TGL55610.1 M48 family peptidase [Leptospira kemamanensis]
MKPINIERKVSKGRNLSLTVYHNGRVVLKHPSSYPKHQIDNFLNEKIDWIQDKLKKIPKDIPNKLNFEPGETIPIFGEMFSISLNEKESFWDPNQAFFIQPFKTELKRQKNAKLILKSILLKKITPIIEKYESNLKTKVTKVSIKPMRSLWGSCNFKNAISINLSLVHCPNFVVEYIVLHEIAHTLQHNHSKKFWDIIKSQDPNYKLAEKWLKETGKKYIHYLN